MFLLLFVHCGFGVFELCVLFCLGKGTNKILLLKLEVVISKS